MGNSEDLDLEQSDLGLHSLLRPYLRIPVLRILPSYIYHNNPMHLHTLNFINGIEYFLTYLLEESTGNAIHRRCN